MDIIVLQRGSKFGYFPDPCCDDSVDGFGEREAESVHINSEKLISRPLPITKVTWFSRGVKVGIAELQ